jgi:hypothetical protein
LTDGQRRLIDLCQRVRFGRVYSVAVCRGEPVVKSGVRWTRLVKVGGENGPHPAADIDDFVLKREVREFLTLIAELGDGAIQTIEVRNGLPVSFEVAETLTT